MKEKMNIYYLDKAYQDYIKPQTRKSQAAEKEESKRRTSGVVLFGFGGTKNYFVPLRVGEQEQKKSEMGLTHGLNKGKNGYLDFSEMVPVQNKDLQLLDISNLPTCNLKRNLQRQARYIQREQKKIMECAAEVYLNCVHYPESKIASECNDILMLEEKERLWREGKVQKVEKKVVKPAEEKKTEEPADKPTKKTYKETNTYKLTVEKYGQKVADKMIADALKQAMTLEKEDKKTEKKQTTSTSSTSKKTVKKVVASSPKKSTSAEKGTVTTVTIQSSPAKGK